VKGRGEGGYDYYVRLELERGQGLERRGGAFAGSLARYLSALRVRVGGYHFYTRLLFYHSPRA